MKPRTYAWWREAVKTELIESGVVTSRGAQAERDAERFMRESETGPLACVPSPKELWRDGESPIDFVQHEHLTVRTEKTEAKFLLSQFKKMVGYTIVSAEIKNGLPAIIVEGRTMLWPERIRIRFSATPGHVDIGKGRPVKARRRAATVRP